MVYQDSDLGVVVIDIPSMNDSVISLVNDGKTFLIRMQWLESIQLWRFAVEDGDGNELTSSSVVPNSPLIYPVRRGDLPNGEFVVYKSGEGRLTYEDVVSGECPFMFVTENN